MQVMTERFGELQVSEQDIISFPQGLLGFPKLTQFCLVDPGDGVLILWLQSLQDSRIAFPVLEPKLLLPNYVAKLSAAELRELGMTALAGAAVFSILTIGADITQMTANFKAPLVLNLKNRIGRQVVLQESEYSIKQPAFKELRAALLSIPREPNLLPPEQACHVLSIQQINSGSDRVAALG